MEIRQIGFMLALMALGGVAAYMVMYYGKMMEVSSTDLQCVAHVCIPYPEICDCPKGEPCRIKVPVLDSSGRKVFNYTEKPRWDDFNTNLPWLGNSTGSNESLEVKPLPGN